MARYIDADALMRILQVEDFGTPDERWKPESEFAQMIESVPTADVLPKYIYYDALRKESYAVAKLYELKRQIYQHICPNCGAKMDGGEE